jgi:hypothetical protein
MHFVDHLAMGQCLRVIHSFYAAGANVKTGDLRSFLPFSKYV